MDGLTVAQTEYDRELKAAVDEALRMLKEGRFQFTTTDAGSK